MKTLKEDQLEFQTSGSYGSYYKIKGYKRGVKLVKNLELAKRELRTLRKVRARLKIVPQEFGLVRVKIGNRLRYGYSMRHINGERCTGYLYTGALYDIEPKLEKANIVHSDLHGGNMLAVKSKSGKTKYFLIDMDPTFIRIKKSKKT